MLSDTDLDTGCDRYRKGTPHQTIAHLHNPRQSKGTHLQRDHLQTKGEY